jgi:hypothetical protein
VGNVRFKRAARVVLLVAIFAALVACGLDILATGGGASGLDDDGGREGATLDGAQGDGADLGDGSQVILPPVPDPFLDAGLDVNPQNCLDGCDGGTCDGGWCVLDCTGQGSCGANVQCPPGIPCDVECGGLGACAKGVDCTQASACKINCQGQGSCANAPVGCSGLGCKIDCSGLGACAKGVDCDASVCAIACTGDQSCRNEATTCNADICSIRCGVAGEIGKDSCSDGIACKATQLCDIGCVAHNDCRNVPITAESAGTTIVQCTGDMTCTRGSILSGAGEAGVVCTGGMGACGQKTYCDAGSCFATCAKDNLTFCCKPGPTCKIKELPGCKISDGGC